MRPFIRLGRPCSTSNSTTLAKKAYRKIRFKKSVLGKIRAWIQTIAGWLTFHGKELTSAERQCIKVKSNWSLENSLTMYSLLEREPLTALVKQVELMVKT